MSAVVEFLVLPFIGAFALWRIQEFNRSRRAPRLRLQTGQGAAWAASRLTPLPGGRVRDALFLRVKVENVGKTTARACRVYLLGVRRPSEARNLRDKPVEVQWAGGRDRERDLPPRLPLFVNVLAWVEGEPAPRGTASDAPDNQFDVLLHAMTGAGETCLLFKFVAIAHETQPCEDEVRCRWGTSWATLRWV